MLVSAATSAVPEAGEPASAACSGLKKGSPKPAHALRPPGPGGKLRSVLSEATEGSMVTA